MKEIDERINEIILNGREKQSIARSSPTVSPPIYAIGDKEACKNNSGLQREASAAFLEVKKSLKLSSLQVLLKEGQLRETSTVDKPL